MITRIGHTAIRARDIEATARFYREVLGMKEAFRMNNPEGTKLGSVHMFVAPSQFIESFPNGSEEFQPTDHTIGHSHICFEVDDAAKFLEEIRERGAPIDRELKRGYSRCIQFWTHDPDGNRIEFMELPPDCLQAEANKRLAGGD
ncbi:MAG: VOC family protein [Treponema sp.]|nr:VOC family protein [Treponema sp.]